MEMIDDRIFQFLMAVASVVPITCTLAELIIIRLSVIIQYSKSLKLFTGDAMQAQHP